MRRKLAALVCVLLLLCALLPSTLAADQMYFVSVNDNMVEYSADTMPIKVSGTMYVPYTVFLSNSNGGINLGVFYSSGKLPNTLSLYGRQKPILILDYGSGITYDTMDNVYSYRAIMRNNTIYVPAWAIADYFDLTYTYSATEFGGLVRIKQEGGYYLDDPFFISSATDNFREQRKQFDRDQAKETSTLVPTPTATPVPTVNPGQKQVQVSFAFRCDSGTGPDGLLDALNRAGEKALFFFRPEDLSRWDDSVRRLVAGGHRIGLIVDGAGAQDCAAQAEEGNRLLAHIVRTRTDFLLVDGSDALRKELSDGGWACWTTSVSGLVNGERRGSSLCANILSRINARRFSARVLMDDSGLSSQALSLLLPQLTGKEYVLRQVSEGRL